MQRTLLWLLLAVLSLIAFGAWWFYGEVVLVWVSIIGNFIKGISLKVILVELLGLFWRWLFVELPKRFLMLLVTIGWDRISEGLMTNVHGRMGCTMPGRTKVSSVL